MTSKELATEEVNNFFDLEEPGEWNAPFVPLTSHLNSFVSLINLVYWYFFVISISLSFEIVWNVDLLCNNWNEYIETEDKIYKSCQYYM